MDINNLKDLTNCELRKIAAECYDILEERKRQEKAKLIEALRIASFNLREAGIEVYYDCDCCGDQISLDFGNLYFD